MHHRYELGPTESYTRRTALWVGGVGTGDGALAITVQAPRELPETKTYWVEVMGAYVLVWESAGGPVRRFYRVTPLRCGCDGMRKMGSPPCKHLSAVRKLVEKRHLRPAGWRVTPHPPGSHTGAADDERRDPEGVRQTVRSG